MNVLSRPLTPCCLCLLSVSTRCPRWHPRCWWSTGRRTRWSTSPTAWPCTSAAPGPWSPSGWRGPGTTTLNCTPSTWRDSSSSSPSSCPPPEEVGAQHWGQGSSQHTYHLPASSIGQDWFSVPEPFGGGMCRRLEKEGFRLLRCSQESGARTAGGGGSGWTWAVHPLAAAFHVDTVSGFTLNSPSLPPLTPPPLLLHSSSWSHVHISLCFSFVFDQVFASLIFVFFYTKWRKHQFLHLETNEVFYFFWIFKLPFRVYQTIALLTCTYFQVMIFCFCVWIWMLIFFCYLHSTFFLNCR